MGIRWLIEELLWFIKGETNANILNNKGVYTWKENSSRSFLDKRGTDIYIYIYIYKIYRF